MPDRDAGNPYSRVGVTVESGINLLPLPMPARAARVLRHRLTRVTPVTRLWILLLMLPHCFPLVSPVTPACHRCPQPSVAAPVECRKAGVPEERPLHRAQARVYDLFIVWWGALDDSTLWRTFQYNSAVPCGNSSSSSCYGQRNSDDRSGFRETDNPLVTTFPRLIDDPSTPGRLSFPTALVQRGEAGTAVPADMASPSSALIGMPSGPRSATLVGETPPCLERSPRDEFRCPRARCRRCRPH